MKFLNISVLTILWPAGSEEDWTASGWCEPGDLGYNHEKHWMPGQTEQKYDHKNMLVCVPVPVRWPLIILSWELKSCLYFSLEDWGTAQSDVDWILQDKKKDYKGNNFSPHIANFSSASSGTQCVNACYYLAYPPSKDGPFCSLVLERLNGALLTGGAGRHRMECALVKS